MNNPLFLNTVLLGGSISEKVAAARATSFDQIELWRQDVESVPKGPGAVQDLLTGDNINLTYYQVVLDFDGAPGDRRAVKRAQATSILDQAVQVGTSTLLAPASTDRGCDPARIDEDMRWLACEGAGLDLHPRYGRRRPASSRTYPSLRWHRFSCQNQGMCEARTFCE